MGSGDGRRLISEPSERLMRVRQVLERLRPRDQWRPVKGANREALFFPSLFPVSPPQSFNGFAEAEVKKRGKMD